VLRLKTVHPNWDCSVPTLARRRKELGLIGVRARTYTDDEISTFVASEYQKANADYDGIRSIQHRLKLRGILIPR
jgi:hypothetical protein